jgi:hypothetical protein
MNQAVNFFWTILCFIPVLQFWIIPGNWGWCLACMAVSLLGLIVPARWLQLSDDPKFYQRLGIRFIKKFVQNGDYANRFARRSDPGYRVIKSKSTVNQHTKTIAMYERYHLFCFLFFTATAIFAIARENYVLSAFLILANIIYNVCPVLLQQYNRARLMRVSGRRA